MDKVAQVSSVQQGLITAAQLAEIGLGRESIRRRCRSGGSWRRVLPGTYLVTPGDPTEAQRTTAALLYVGGECAITGITALRAADLRSTSRLADAPVHVLIPHTRRRSTTGFVQVERTINWPTVLDHTGAAPAVPLARAALDAARRITEPATTRAILSELVQSRRCALDELNHELGTSQRRGTAIARETLRILADGPASEPEIRLYEQWQASDLPVATWNPDVFTTSGEFLCRPDAFIEAAGVVVEVDSREFHYSSQDWEHTMRRHSKLTARGLAVLHVTPRRLRDDWPGIVREVVAVVAAQEDRALPRLVVRPQNSAR